MGNPGRQQRNLTRGNKNKPQVLIKLLGNSRPQTMLSLGNRRSQSYPVMSHGCLGCVPGVRVAGLVNISVDVHAHPIGGLTNTHADIHAGGSKAGEQQLPKAQGAWIYLRVLLPAPPMPSLNIRPPLTMEMTSPRWAGTQLWAGSGVLPARAGAGSRRSSNLSELAAPRHLPGSRPPPPSSLQGSQLTANGQQYPLWRLIIFLGCREIVLFNYPRAAADAPTRQRRMHSPAAPRRGRAGSSPQDQKRGCSRSAAGRDPRERGLARRVGRVGRSYMLKVGGVARQ